MDSNNSSRGGRHGHGEDRKAKAKIQETKGKVKQRFGEMTGNRSLQAKGKAEKVKGSLRLAAEKTKDAFRK
ncbi:CsbD family protein [Nonomuraea sp. NPDC003727]